MTTPDNSTKRFGDITIEFDHDCDDHVSAALSMLAYGLAKLSKAERDRRLEEIEDGELRRAVRGFAVSQVMRNEMRRQLAPDGAGRPQ